MYLLTFEPFLLKCFEVDIIARELSPTLIFEYFKYLFVRLFECIGTSSKYTFVGRR